MKYGCRNTSKLFSFHRVAAYESLTKILMFKSVQYFVSSGARSFLESNPISDKKYLEDQNSFGENYPS